MTRTGERGLFRGCCALGVVLIVLVAVGVFLGTRALAAPDLGPPPGGTAHGSSEALVAASLAENVAAQLVAGEHAVVVLSEVDLTLLAQAHNPSPDRFRNPQARIRNGQIVVSATSDLGPFGTTDVVDLTLSFSTSNGQVAITATPTSYSVGQLGIPSFIATHVGPNAGSTLNLTQLFNGNPPLEVLANSIECIAVQPDGVHIGFHRPGSTPDSSTCTNPAYPAQT